MQYQRRVGQLLAHGAVSQQRGRDQRGCRLQDQGREPLPFHPRQRDRLDRAAQDTLPTEDPYLHALQAQCPPQRRDLPARGVAALLS